MNCSRNPGGKPLDWPQISRQVNDILQATPVDDFEQGYWVDLNQAMPAGKISFDIESLKRDLPEDIRSGLNWSPDKKFFFLVSVLTPRPSPAIPPDESQYDPRISDDAADENPDDEKPDLDGFVATLPEMRDKEAAALVEARNSVVAAWLWRKFAAGQVFRRGPALRRQRQGSDGLTRCLRRSSVEVCGIPPMRPKTSHGWGTPF